MAAVTIRYQVFNSRGELVEREKTFKTEAQMQKWVAKQEETNGDFVGVTAYSF